MHSFIISTDYPLKGIKRVTAERKATGETKITEGKDKLDFALYKIMCEAMLKSSKKQLIFARAFKILSWNLGCRSSNTSTVLLKHLRNDEDAIAIMFAHQKNDQEGERQEPRHCYANPSDPALCMFLALAIYLMCFGFDEEANKLFAGANSYDRYTKALQTVYELPEVKDALEKYGIVPKDLGAHSDRKGAGSHLSGGSTAGPSHVAICLRLGWLLEGVEKRYLRYEAAGDQYVGRILAGLNLNSGSFALLPPFFRAGNDGLIKNAMDACFPGWANTGIPPRVLEYLLASAIYHHPYLSSELPRDHQFRSTPLFTNKEMTDSLRRIVVCKIGSEGDPIRATGIPPHVTMYTLFADLRTKAEETITIMREESAKVCKNVTQFLEEKAVGLGTVTTAGLEEKIRLCLEGFGVGRIVSYIEGGGNVVNQQKDGAEPVQGPPQLFMWGDGMHIVPENFTFPKGNVRTAWQAYCCGNQGEGYPALRTLKSVDLSNVNAKKRLSDFRFLMNIIEEKVKEAGRWVAVPTLLQANVMYDAVKDEVLPKPQGKKRARPGEMEWTSVVTMLRTASKRARDTSSEDESD